MQILPVIGTQGLRNGFIPRREQDLLGNIRIAASWDLTVCKGLFTQRTIIITINFYGFRPIQTKIKTFITLFDSLKIMKRVL